MLAITVFFAMGGMPALATEANTLPKAVNGTITLTENVVLTDTVIINDKVTIDLNGFTISNATEIWKDVEGVENDRWSLISVRNGGDLTIKGEGTLKALANDCYAIDVLGGKVTINSGNYIGNISSVYVYKGDLTVNGGKFSIQQLSNIAVNKYKYLLNCYDDNYTNGTANIAVKGGTFNNFNPSDIVENTTQGKTGNYLVEGYKVSKNGDNYVVTAIHSHNYGVEWKSDITNHWKECSCGEKANLSKHTTEVKNAVEATINKAGYTGDTVCTVCNKVIAEGKVIPVLANVEKETVKVEKEAIDKAILEAENDKIILDLTQKGETITNTELPTESIGDVKETNKQLEIKTKNITVTFDNKALEKIAEEVGDNKEVTLKVEKIKEETLSEKQKEAIKGKEISMIISAELITGNKTISNFNTGKVTVKIPFTPEKDSKGEEYKIIYIANNGDIEEISTKYVDGYLVAELTHFSNYAIVKQVSEISKVEEDKIEEKDETPKTGVLDLSLYVYAILGAVVLIGAVKAKNSKHSK